MSYVVTAYVVSYGPMKVRPYVVLAEMVTACIGKTDIGTAPYSYGLYSYDPM